MGLFTFLDSRKSLAKWTAKFFKKVYCENSTATAQNIAEAALCARYQIIGLKPHQQAILRDRAPQVRDIFTFCHLLAEVELLSHLSSSDRCCINAANGENVIQHTYGVMDAELKRHGFGPEPTFSGLSIFGGAL